MKDFIYRVIFEIVMLGSALLMLWYAHSASM